ncbi:hypothetical protein BaRGS_00012322 [Batillaria attramentaria]|uniref:Right handed beta helix domain-containing protein n=1 Tax=Batillaria attramentaria TaxID=370345 RepID=A0ABD0LAJ5_9CAEN
MDVSAVLTLLLCLTVVHSATVHIYVSPAGSDTNDGRSTSHPVKTLQHAVDMLGQLGISGNNVFVELIKGYHDLTSTLHFTDSIHGSATFRAYQGQEVHVVGGKRIASDHFRHVTDPQVLHRLPSAAHAHVLEVDLTSEGITDLGQLNKYIYNQKGTAPLEVFINGKPLQLSRWPNQGYANITALPDGLHGKRITYQADGSRDSAWTQEPDPWTYGFWCRGWADATLPVASVDPHTHIITLGDLEYHGVCVSHLGEFIKSVQGGYFRVINMMSELDSPGEYYVDRNSKKLYIWPDTQSQTLSTSDIVYASTLTDCIRIESNVQNLHFEDFTLEACRRYGFSVNNGHHLTFKNLEIKNTGSYGINCEKDCRSVSVLASEIHDTTGGVWISGGDRTTLTSSNNVIRDNHVWDYSRMSANIGDAVRVADGVNTKVIYNHFHHGKYTGVRFFGNDHLIQNNHVHHMCTDTSDCGAIHTNGHWTYRGNLIEKNHIHHVLRNKPGPDVRGVMLDDEFCSALTQQNVFYDNECHLNIGGGRDNVVRYNIFYNATAHSIQVDGRGLDRPEHGVNWQRELQKLPYTTGIWAQKYPELVDILNHNASAPEGSADGPEDFWSPATADFRPHCDAQTWAQAHHIPAPVTVREVGPQVPTGPHYLRGETVHLVNRYMQLT